jgi:hypothetical protein
MGKQLAQMPLSGFKNYLNYAVALTDSAKKLKDLTQKEAPGQFSFTDSQGNTFKYITPESKTKGENEKELITVRGNLKELTNLLNNVPDEFFGPQAIAPAYSTPALEWLSGIPGLKGLKPSKKDIDKAVLFSKYNGQVNRMAMDTIKQLSGLAYTDQQLDFMKEFIPSIGPGTTRPTFDGKAKGLVEYYNRVEEAKQRLLDKGIEISKDPDSKYGKAMLQELKNIKLQTNFSPEIEAGINYNMSQYGYSREEAISLMKSRGMIK